jgi:multiple sugar transport system substrate-binding protein
MAEFFNFVKEAQQYAPPTMEKNFFGRNVGMWMQYGYSWEPNLKSALNEPMVIGEDVGIASVPVPAAGDPSFTTLGGRALMILRTAPDREARAWDFIKFLMEDENNLQFISELGYLPFVTALESDAYFQDPGRQPFIELMKNGRVPEQFAAAEKVAAAIQGVYQKVVVEGSVPIEEAVAQAAAAARDALKTP